MTASRLDTLASRLLWLAAGAGSGAVLYSLFAAALVAARRWM